MEAISAYEEDIDALDRADLERARAEFEALLRGALPGNAAFDDVLSSSTTSGLEDVAGVGVASAGGGGFGGFRRRGGSGFGGLGRRGGSGLSGLGRRGGSSGLGGLGRHGGSGVRAGPAPARVTVRAEASGGLDGLLVTRVVRGHLAALRRCHVVAAQRDPTLAGAVSVRLTISTGGAAEGASASGSASDQGLRTCVRGVVERALFPVADRASRATITAEFRYPGGAELEDDGDETSR